MSWIGNILAPVGNLLQNASMSYVGRKSKQAEQTTRQYLETVTPDSCLEDLSSSLKQLLNIDDTIDSIFKQFASKDDVPVWREDNFTKYFEAKFGEQPPSIASVRVLWQIFLSAAYFPFSTEQVGHQPFGSHGVGYEAFIRAYALLVLRGFELIGNKQDGNSLSWNRAKDRSYTEKTPRLARIIYGCLKDQHTLDGNQVQDVKDVLGLTQPITWSAHPFVPSAVTEDDFDTTAKRLLQGSSGEKAVSERSGSVSRNQLQHLVQMLLLVRLEDEILRKGVGDDLYIRSTSSGAEVNTKRKRGDEFLTTIERTGDTRVAGLVLSETEVAQSADMVPAVIESFFGTDDMILDEKFEDFCKESSAFLLLFFHLWTAIFESTSASQGADGKALPSRVVNSLCLLNIAEFRTFTQGSNYRWHNNEVQFHLDLQSSKLVAGLSSHEQLSSTELCQAIMPKNVNAFHVVVISGIDLDPGETAQKGAEGIIAALLSPPASAGKSMEMWRMRGGKRDVQYLWQRSMIQLQPTVVMGEKRKGMSMLPNASSNLLELRANEALADGAASSITIDLSKKTVSLVGVGGDFEVLQMHLNDLKCYRLPGEGVEITYSSNSPYAQ